MAHTLILDEQEIEDLAAGCCPRSVQAMARFALESDEGRLARNALRPVRTTKSTKKKSVRAAEREC